MAVLAPEQEVELAAKSENFEEAARIRDSLKSFEEEDPILRLRGLMREAIAKEKFEEELKSTTIKIVEQSKVLNTPRAEKQTNRELFDALRQELETPVLEKASKSVWELILDNNGLGREINETVEKVFCRLSGREPPFFPSNGELQLEKGKDKGGEQGKGKAKEVQSEKDNVESTSKKRKLETKNVKDSVDEVAK